MVCRRYNWDLSRARFLGGFLDWSAGFRIIDFGFVGLGHVEPVLWEHYTGAFNVRLYSSADVQVMDASTEATH